MEDDRSVKLKNEEIPTSLLWKLKKKKIYFNLIVIITYAFVWKCALEVSVQRK